MNYVNSRKEMREKFPKKTLLFIFYMGILRIVLIYMLENVSNNCWIDWIIVQCETNFQNNPWNYNVKNTAYKYPR